MTTKVCRVCEVEKAVGECAKRENLCKACQRERSRKYYQSHKAHIKPRVNRYYHENHEVCVQRIAQYREENRDRINQQIKEYPNPYQEG
jgi:hypothetical protein